MVVQLRTPDHLTLLPHTKRYLLDGMSPHRGSNFRQFVNFLAQVKQGEVDGVKVRLHRLQSLISSSYIEHLECTRDEDLDIHLHHSLMYVD